MTQAKRGQGCNEKPLARNYVHFVQNVLIILIRVEALSRIGDECFMFVGWVYGGEGTFDVAKHASDIRLGCPRGRRVERSTAARPASPGEVVQVFAGPFFVFGE